jgi:hypothetical protein
MTTVITVRSGNPDTEFVPDEIIDRFCVLGPIEKHQERIGELGDLGVDQFVLNLTHDDSGGQLKPTERKSGGICSASQSSRRTE